MAVPSVYLNGDHFGQGRMTLAEIVNKLDTGAAEKKAAELNAREPYEVLIVGGGLCRASAAIYAAARASAPVVAERLAVR